MSLINTLKTDNFDQFRINTNTIASQLGDNAVLVANTTLSSTNAVSAIIEVLDKQILEAGNIGTLTTTATNLVGAINEHDAEIGVLSTLTTTAKNTLVASINELDGDVGNKATLTTTAKTSLVNAVNELDAEHGVLSSLTTTNKTTFVASINEVVQRETDRYANTLKYDLTHSTVGGNNNTTQSILSNLSMPAGKTFTVNGTLDISTGTLIVGGGGSTLNIAATYLNLGDPVAVVASSGGVVVDRGESSPGVTREDVRIYWDEPSKKWSLKKFDDAGAPTGTNPITPWIIDSYNAKDLIANNVESGIAVTWDAANSNFDFDVNDFTITLTGDVTGVGTVTNLGNVSFATTIAANSVALGTDTTGAYVSSISLAATTPGISVTQSAAGAETNALTNLSVDSTVVRDFGVQTIGGVKTFSSKPVFSSGITSSAASSFAGQVTITTGGLSVTGDTVLSGNLTVTGTTTYINTETMTVDDNIIVLNNNAAATPTENAGIEVERGNSTNVTILWDETNDDWTFNNATATYFMTGEIVAGTAINVAQDATEKAKWTVTHADTSSVGNLSSDNSGNTFIQDISFVFDGMGHVTSAAVVTNTVAETPAFQTVAINGTDSGYTWGLANTNTNQTADSTTDTLTIVKGGGINLYTDTSGATDAIKIEHADTSSVSNLSSDNTGYTYIQDLALTFDTYGHVTAATAVTATWSATIANITNSTEDIQDIVGAMFDGVGNPDEFGISISYNDTTGKIQANVNDPTITLTGAVTGSAVMSNLGDVTIDTSISGAIQPRIYNVAGTQLFP